MISINPNTRQLPLLLQRARDPRALLSGLADEATSLLKAHFLENDRININKLAPDRRTHFWITVADSVRATVTGNTITLTVNHPALAQKVYGGPIVAKRVRNLAIPVERQAYGCTPRDFERETGLKLFVLKGKKSLVLATATAAGVQVEFVLKPAYSNVRIRVLCRICRTIHPSRRP